MQKPLLLLVTLGLLSLAGCQQQSDDMQPLSYDALALETGHWEWESTTYQIGKRTPATEGFTRQLVFSAGGNVVIQHDKKLNKQSSYALSMGSLPSCGAPQTSLPIITYETDSDLPNNDRKTYNITKSPTGQNLVLVGENACVDGGAYETYHWVKE